MSTAVRWEASNAYFSASSVDTHIFAGHDLSYIYRKPNLKKTSDPYQLFSSNEGADFLAKWFEKDDQGVGIEREITMDFGPNDDVRRWETEVDAVDNHGWRLERFEVLDDSYGGSQRQTLAWDRNSRRGNTVDADFLSVPEGREVFHCEYVELSLFPTDGQGGRLDTSIAEGKFVARDFMLGAYLPTDGYSCSINNGSCSGVDIYNPCRATGKPCSAINGLVYCGTELLNDQSRNADSGNDMDEDVDRSPFSFSGSLLEAREWTERNGAIIEWTGDYAYMKSERTTVALKGDMDTNDAIFYSFEDDFGRDQTISSGTNGQQIGRTYPWVEDGAYRGLTFSFQPNKDSTDEYNPQKDAREHGWALKAARVRDQDGSWLQWQAGEGSNRYEDQWISVPRSDQLFFCNSVQLNFGTSSASSYNSGVTPRSSTAEASFIGQNLLLGAFLDDMNIDRMEHYNPCGNGRECRIVDSTLYCEDRIVEKRKETSSNVSWLGDRSFLEARNVQVSLDGFASYTFEDDRRRDPSLISGRDGSIIGWVDNWFEDGKRRQMQMQLSRDNDEEDTTRSGWQLESLQLLDDYGQVIQYEPSPEMRSIVSIPKGFDSFHCDHVEFTLRTKYSGRARGTFEAEDFAVGGYLRSNYQFGRYRGNEYNPCRPLGYGYDEECRIIDDSLYCGDETVDVQQEFGEASFAAVRAARAGAHILTTAFFLACALFV